MNDRAPWKIPDIYQIIGLICVAIFCVFVIKIRYHTNYFDAVDQYCEEKQENKENNSVETTTNQNDDKKFFPFNSQKSDLIRKAPQREKVIGKVREGIRGIVRDLRLGSCKFNDILCLKGNKNRNTNRNNYLTNKTNPLTCRYNVTETVHKTTVANIESTAKEYQSCKASFHTTSSFSTDQSPISHNIERCPLSKGSISHSVCDLDLNNKLPSSVANSDNNPDHNQLFLEECLIDKKNHQKQKHSDNQESGTWESEKAWTNVPSSPCSIIDNLEQSCQQKNSETDKKNEECTTDTNPPIQQSSFREVTAER
ncbi:hypothetical protein CDIK_2278 [Cucumispora dikerogammari]|nr:hypothetical protein CDIK_2278 [Cucumispora dikerogammari]